ncbi:MAG: leucyl aminopeptidase family protein [Alphaproteobacteria bacterium]|nr:leucyl aminopeptidase family protein [Alphaproteobacteria bacterium]
MTQIPLLDAPVAAAIPIHALRTSEWETWATTRPDSLRKLAQVHDFKAQNGRILVVPATNGEIERVLFGVGDKATAMTFGLLAQQLPSGDYTIAWAPRDLDPTLIATAWALGAYAFDRYKPRKRAAPRLVASDGMDATEARHIAEAVHLARNLVNTPANDMGPEALQAAAQSVADECDAEFEAIVGDELLARNFPMIHAVGRAAKEAPRILRLTWGDEGAPRVALVGKGVTFDSGGLDIKPDSGMRLMKKDMGGAAVALSLGRLIMRAKLPVRLEVILPVVENAISGDAFRPGDVVPTRKGLTVEVDNTDAEGRLILSDALTLACEGSPDILLDFATLTGAARVALGPDITPFYTDDETLAADLATASKSVADPIWRLPLWDAYDPDMDSPIADLKNTGDAGMAGSIYGGLFLRKFVTVKSWAHFDIYAWTPRERPARPQGGDAHALRACFAMLRERLIHN